MISLEFKLKTESGEHKEVKVVDELFEFQDMLEVYSQLEDL